MSQKNLYPLFATAIYKNKLDIVLTDLELSAIRELDSSKQVLGTQLSTNKFILEKS